MFLNSLILHNFRKFENLELHFNERLSVLVGNNGTGKSTILEAATIAAGTFTSAMDGLTNYGIRKTDAHYKYFKMGSVIDVQPQFPVSISAQGDIDGKCVQWERVLNYANGRSTLIGAKELTSIAKEYQDRMRNGDTSLKLPIISYYGAGRLWVQHKEKKNDAFETSSRYNGYIDSLDGAANDKLMMKWFQRMTFKQYQKNEEIPELKVVCKAMEQSFASATGYEDVKMYYNPDINDIDISYKDSNGEYAIIPMSQMSDGYRCTISLIADIAYRMALLNPQLLADVLTQTEGIILIDEIDLPIIVDAGIGRPSQACEAMEMGASAVMANTAIATAGDVQVMAEAFKKAIEAGRKAYLSGLGRVLTRGASASDPLTGFLH